MQAIETALIVPVPEAEEVVGEHRARFDTAARWGVPAHVTVLYPFVAPDEVTDDVLAAVAETVAAHPRFDVEFARVSWFGDHVAWLAPRPDQPFRALTAALWERFPQHPPYRGEFDDVVPHLTIGHDVPVDDLRAAADAVSASLPLRARAREVWLMVGAPEPDAWRTAARFTLGDT
ncbi:2'-5' RNA ligase family protein [Asanoa sp. WMMD1127]|uniref:2'-5' RNA ligase family protein n=1 Tax=Asanoa sp. WMMD1127 TaxID=3016107 RepID=UPI002415DC49|nr:2'-5' RNA ligase family protein [Asanoa sp. WMMD1127]MDG4826042.1 2'-5' RNA ligase family protein [Asanoa sp. WMMD1127]